MAIMTNPAEPIEACHPLGLPPELRLYIYELVFRNCWARIYFGKVPFYIVLKHEQAEYEEDQPAVNLFATCKQIRIEATPVLFEKTRIQFDLGFCPLRFVRELDERGFLPRERYASTEVMIDPDDYCVDRARDLIKRFNGMPGLPRLDFYCTPSSRILPAFESLLSLLELVKCQAGAKVMVHRMGSWKLLGTDERKWQAVVGCIEGSSGVDAVSK